MALKVASLGFRSLTISSVKASAARCSSLKQVADFQSSSAAFCSSVTPTFLPMRLRLAEDPRARDRQFAHYGIKLAPVTDRATEPAVLFKILWRVRHHAEDVGVVILAEDFKRAFV